jgi:hypothetical protein
MTAPTPAEVIAKLGELDADELARLFADEDIVGTFGSYECPVARYVHQQTGEHVHVYGTAEWVHGKRVFSLPASITEFVKRFDSERYPLQMAPANRDEITAVNLADEHAEEATRLLGAAGVEHRDAAVVHALLSLGARIDALRETLNRELPDLGESILDIARNVPSE